MKYLLFILSFIYIFRKTNSLYFHLFRDQERCFYDEFYSELIVMVRYNILDKNIAFNNKNEERINIIIKSIDQKKDVYKFVSQKLSGKFSYTIEKSILILHRWTLQNMCL